VRLTIAAGLAGGLNRVEPKAMKDRKMTEIGKYIFYIFFYI
jgi:hypothetical protein